MGWQGEASITHEMVCAVFMPVMQDHAAAVAPKQRLQEQG